jgi:hypothetical protein
MGGAGDSDFASLKDDVKACLDAAGIAVKDQEARLDGARAEAGIAAVLHRESSVYQLYKNDFAHRLLFYPEELFILATRLLRREKGGSSVPLEEPFVTFLMAKLAVEKRLKDMKPGERASADRSPAEQAAREALSTRAYVPMARLFNGSDAHQKDVEDLMRRLLDQGRVRLPMSDKVMTAFLESEAEMREAERRDAGLAGARMKYVEAADRCAEEERQLRAARRDNLSVKARWNQSYGGNYRERSELIESESLYLRRIALKRQEASLGRDEIEGLLEGTELRKRIDAARDERNELRDLPAPVELAPGAPMPMDEVLDFNRRWREAWKLVHEDGPLYALASDDQRSAMQELCRDLTSIDKHSVQMGMVDVESFAAVEARILSFMKDQNLEGRMSEKGPAERREMYRRLVEGLETRIDALVDESVKLRSETERMRADMANEELPDWYEREIGRLGARVEALRAEYETLFRSGGARGAGGED